MELLFTDTDSLYYSRECEDFEADLQKVKDILDYSGYKPVDGKPHPYFNNENKMVVGKFKCETGGVPIVEFVGLRPKMYSILTRDYHDQTDQGKEKIRVKGVSRAAAKLLRHADFLNQLNSPTENYLTNRRIGSERHQIFTMEVWIHLHFTKFYLRLSKLDKPLEIICYYNV